MAWPGEVTGSGTVITTPSTWGSGSGKPVRSVATAGDGVLDDLLALRRLERDLEPHVVPRQFAGEGEADGRLPVRAGGRLDLDAADLGAVGGGDDLDDLGPGDRLALELEPGPRL